MASSTTSTRALTLIQHVPEWDLPSRDPECPVAHAYLKYGEMPFNVRNTNKAVLSSTGRLPVLEDGTKIVEETSEILKHLKSIGLDLDAQLSNQQKIDSSLLVNLIRTNYYTIIGLELAYYNKPTPFFPRRGWFHALRLIPLEWRLNDVALGVRGTLTPSERLSQAKDIFASLSLKLGANAFFFGNRPSTVDAYAFGYLSVTLRTPGLERLANALFDFPNLVEYCQRHLFLHWNIAVVFVRPTPEQLQRLEQLRAKSSSSSSSDPAEEEDEFKIEASRKRTAQQFAVVGVLGLASLFLYNNRELFRHMLPAHLPLRLPTNQ